MGNLTRLDELYHAALAQPEDGRTSFLAEACAGDDALRHELESLLAHTGTGNGDSFLNQVFTSPSTSEPRRAVCGEQIGPYTIVDFIGAGEMGEVYRATDTKLKRQVAIKILPPSLATDAQRLTRFQREAEVLAALNHPNIAAIYGLEESPPTRDGEAGLRALVMELVEGPTLESMLASGGPVTGRAAQRSERKRTAALHKGLPCDQALSIARQIAEALEAAHEHNIIHRDLKPANIKVRSDGVLKLLDFGLAKALDRAGDADRSRPLVDPAGVVVTEPDSPNAQNRPAISPSRSSAPPAHLRPDDEKLTITGTGMILGTAAYMSPEQAHGHEDLDRRVDLWAFGVVLWEMLTGTRPFDGATMSDTLATVARTEPDWTALPANTPALARRLLRRCLEKDRRQRLDSAAMARLEIEDALAAPLDDLNASATASMHHTRWSFVVLAAAAASGILALIGPTMLSRRDSPPPAMPETRLDIVTPATSDPISFALSPDGRQLAFVASGGGTSRLWLRAFADGTARPLPGTEGAAFPFWSPDSQSVGFFADSRLKRLDIIAGAPQTVASAPAGRGGTWNADGIILFAASISRALSRVAASGGPAAAATTLNPLTAGLRHPVFLPDGRHFLFFLQAAGIHLGALDSDDLSKLTPADSHGVYLPPTATGHINVQQNGASILNAWRGLHRPVNGSGEGGWLLWVKDGTLVAQQFDLARGVLTGDRLTLARSVAFDPVRGASAVSVSATGLVAYRTGSASRGTLMWTDRSGKVLETLGPILPNDTNIRAPSLSPDGRRVVVYRGALNNQGIWLLDGSRLSRFTLNGVQARFPVWSPDGKQIVFDKIRGGASDLYLKPAGGAEPEVLLVGSTPKNNLALDWSPDGRFILYESLNGEASSDLWVVPVAGSRTPQVLFSAPFDQLDGRFSQDGRWVAYASNESGRSEIYIRPFVPPTRQVRADSHGMQWQVSTDGGITPAWSHDGKELYFIAPDGTMMAAPISAHGSTVRAGVPLALFPTRIMYGGGNAGMGRQYDIARDGRFLINAVVDDAASHITLIQNWMPASTQ